MSDRRSLGVVALLAPLLFLACAEVTSQGQEEESATMPGFVTTDVENFWRLLDLLPTAATREDSLRLLQKEYLHHAGPCVREVLEMEAEQNGRDVEAELLKNLRSFPRYFGSLRKSAKGLEAQIRATHAVYERFADIYPHARPADLYLGFGIFNTGSNARDCGIYIAAEMSLLSDETDLSEFEGSKVWWIDDAARLTALPVTAVHELVHMHQRLKRPANLLEQALMEGAAEFVAELVTGHVTTTEARRYGKEHEQALWKAFAEEMHQRDIYNSRWFFGPADAGRPSDLGYFVGYKIVEAFYRRAVDTTDAVTRIIEVEDARSFLLESQYAGGAR